MQQVNSKLSRISLPVATLSANLANVTKRGIQFHGEALARLRTQKGLSQRDFAKLSGISERAIAGYESQQVASARYEQFRKLVFSLGVSSEELLGSHTPGQPSPTFRFVVDLPIELADSIRAAAAEKHSDISAFTQGVLASWVAEHRPPLSKPVHRRKSST